MMMLSCDDAGQKKFEFFYYPERNVYYDVTNSMYLYSLDGGTTWDSLHAKMNKDSTTLGSKEIIYSTSPGVWADNDAHIQQYNGHIINITGNDSLSQNDLAAERKAKKIKAAATKSEKKSEKKPGFFKRLFGKKN
ncbi:MAG: hypothetical protein ABI405_09770 [Parafilimonas sp.]